MPNRTPEQIVLDLVKKNVPVDDIYLNPENGRFESAELCRDELLAFAADLLDAVAVVIDDADADGSGATYGAIIEALRAAAKGDADAR